MTFIHTKHAIERLKTRGIPPPDSVRAKECGKRGLRSIAYSCLNFDPVEYTYFRAEKKYIYVTKKIEDSIYLLITAFNIKNK